MAKLTPQQVTVGGLAPSFDAADAGGDTCQPDDRVFLRVKNGSAAEITVTVVVPGSSYGIANPDPTVSVPATTGDVLIALPPALADLTTGLVGVTYSGVTNLTVALVRV